ncbi:hypothetical protein RJT34_11992 [Clitoria ternatea]|uniref:RRM domain-containing protein n=1 Tax=Clitoria ternatea TaxID=43366 RepID=A0AAN9PK21_CLITE
MEKNEEKIREMEVGMMEKNSKKEWELMGTRLLLEQMKEERARGDEVMEKWKQPLNLELEAVASQKISAETHLLNEKEEHLKEIEVLQAQVDQNKEVTRFTMENLQLREEIRRHASNDTHELEEILYCLFSQQYGRILDAVAVKTPKLRGQAWVCFSEVTAASNAVQQMQNFPFYDKPMILGGVKNARLFRGEWSTTISMMLEYPKVDNL